METLIFLPLAITNEDENWGCVAGIDCNGTWVRPSPIPRAWTSHDDPFRYGAWSKLTVSPHPNSTRPEDRLISGLPVLERSIDAADYRNLLAANADPDVCTAFAGNRTAGLIRVRVEAIYARPHTRGRTFLRIVFTDNTNERFDWIVPEVATNKALAAHIQAAAPESDSAKRWVDETQASEVFFTIGLTFPNERFPGRFGGCHPLVVGIHRFRREGQQDG